MFFTRSLGWVAAVALISSVTTAPLLAAPSNDGASVATEVLRGTRLTVTPRVAYETAVLRVSGPDDYALSKHFAAEAPISVDLLTDAEAGESEASPVLALADGRYRYEVVFTTPGAESHVRTGLFFVTDGIAVARQVQRRALANARKNLSVARAETTAKAAATDNVGPEYETVFDWIGIYDYEDSGSAPLQTWLSLKHVHNGLGYGDMWSVYHDAGNLLFVEDGSYFSPSGGTTRMTIEDNSGEVGIGTTTPLEELHIDSSDGADIRLTGSGADWVVGILASSNQFILRDASHNASIVRLDQGAPASSLVISTDGRIGLGTASPAADLDVRGHVRGTTFASASSRELKTGFQAVDRAEVLTKVSELPVTSWRYRDDDEGATHIGPVAEDFQRLFGLGDGETISTVDSDGVLLAALQGLNAKVDRALAGKQAEIDELREQVADLKRRLAAAGGT